MNLVSLRAEMGGRERGIFRRRSVKKHLRGHGVAVAGGFWNSEIDYLRCNLIKKTIGAYLGA